METIGLGKGAVDAAEEVADKGVAGDFERMGGLVAGRLLVVVEGGGELVGDVLPEGAAKGDVENLHAATDGEDGAVGGNGDAGERELEGVTLGLGGDLDVEDLLAVVRGIDVLAAGEEEPVKVVQGGFDGRRAGDRGEEDREAAGEADGVDVGFAGRDHLAPGRRFSDVRGDADQRCARRGGQGVYRGR